MSSEQTPGQPADLAALRAAALATKKQAEDAAAALLAADPTSEPPPPPASGGPRPPPRPVSISRHWKASCPGLSRSPPRSLRDGITAVTRENTVIKASQARLESQRRRVNDVGKSEGKTVSLAKQLDFIEDLLADGHQNLNLKPRLNLKPCKP